MQKLIALFIVVLAGYLAFIDWFMISVILIIFAIGLLLTTKRNEVLDFDTIYSQEKRSSDNKKRR